METKTARQRRHDAENDGERQRHEELQKEKENCIEEFLISKDYRTLVASYYGHHICVFDVPTLSHIQTLENPNSLLLLHVAALSDSGNYLAHANYDEETKVSYVTLWNTRKGTVKRRSRNEKDVCVIATSEDADKIVFGNLKNELRIWCPKRPNSMRRIKGYTGLKFSTKSKIVITEGGLRAVVYAGDISLWDLERGEVLAVFTPDMNIQCFMVAMDGKMIIYGRHDTSKIVTLRVTYGEKVKIQREGPLLFGEKDDSDDDDSDDDEEAGPGEEDED